MQSPYISGIKSGLGRLACAWALAAALLSTAGCESSRPQLGAWDGPQLLSTSSLEVWSFRGEPAHRVRSPHYLIYSTIADEDVLQLLPQVMEGALSQYKRVAPGVTPASTEAPMECFVFERRLEWEAFTRAHAGKDADVYLQIRRGGYAIKDRFVAYYIGRQATASVAAHEGWHQYVARHFVGRLPPFLEEGLACMFEGIAWRDELPRWNLSINQVRVQALRRGAETDKLWPLEKLVSMHAGEVVEQNGEKVEAFYAQAWTFARFLYESEGGRFRPALQKWLADTAAGNVYDPTRTHNSTKGHWNRNAVRPMIEYYLGLDFASIDQLYKAYLRRVAFDEYAAQWNS